MGDGKNGLAALVLLLLWFIMVMITTWWLLSGLCLLASTPSVRDATRFSERDFQKIDAGYGL